MQPRPLHDGPLHPARALGVGRVDVVEQQQGPAPAAARTRRARRRPAVRAQSGQRVVGGAGEPFLGRGAAGAAQAGGALPGRLEGP